MKTAKEIGKDLKGFRTDSGFSQGTIASFLGVDQSYVSKIESGERPVSTDMLEKLMNLYGYPLDALEKSNVQREPLRVSFRADGVSKEDMEAVCDVNRIALNSIWMSGLLEGQDG